MRFLMILTLIGSFAFLGCTKQNGGDTPAPSPVVTIGCSIEQSLSGTLAVGVAKALSCTESGAIESDILAAMGKANLCTSVSTAKATIAKMKSAGENKAANDRALLGSIVCPPVGAMLSSALISTIPATWKCAPQATVAQATSSLVALCISAVPL